MALTSRAPFIQRWRKEAAASDCAKMNTRGLGSQLKDCVPISDFSAGGAFENHDVMHRGRDFKVAKICYKNNIQIRLSEKQTKNIKAVAVKKQKKRADDLLIDELQGTSEIPGTPFTNHWYRLYIGELRKFTNVKNELFPVHPLELSEKNFLLSQDKMNFSTLRNIQGLHAPLKLQMEFKAVKQAQRLPFLHSSNLSLDILKGNYDCIGFEDILNDPAQSEVMGDPHLMVEHKLGLL